MDVNKILNADILDIIFEGKNKEYGAYDLRKTYNKRLLRAIIGTSIIILRGFSSDCTISARVLKPLTVVPGVAEDSSKAVF